MCEFSNTNIPMHAPSFFGPVICLQPEDARTASVAKQVNVLDLSSEIPIQIGP
jgi:hypothetical protein